MTCDIINDGLFPVIHLHDAEGGCSAEIYSFGGLLNAFSIGIGNKVHNVIDGFASPQDAKDNITNGFKSAKLSPFVCRVTNGKFIHNNHHHSIKKFFLGTEAIHGLIYDALFNIKAQSTDAESASVTLQYEYNNKDEGFPYQYSAEVIYTLQKHNRLLITTVVTNAGSSSMPLTDGWHPYFSLGCKVNDALLQLNSSQMLEFSGRLVPTGEYVSHTNFLQTKHLGETFLDNCFVLDGIEKPACTLKNEANGLQLIIHAKQNYPYLQVYTPPHRNSIAIENLSGAPDAFNNGIGIIIVEPGEQYTFAAEYQLQLQP